MVKEAISHKKMRDPHKIIEISQNKKVKHPKNEGRPRKNEGGPQIPNSAFLATSRQKTRRRGHKSLQNWSLIRFYFHVIAFYSHPLEIGSLFAFWCCSVMFFNVCCEQTVQTVVPWSVLLLFLHGRCGE